MSGAGPRTLFVTGPGGDGTTTVAAATALGAAREGRATLLLSAAPPARLADLLGAAPPVYPETAPGPAGPGWEAARIDPAATFREGLLALQTRVRPALDAAGAEPFDEDELTELPGAHAPALLQAVRAAHATGRWEQLVVDLPPLPDGLKLLALPAQLRRYLRRLLPPERVTARALRPLLAQLAGVPLPFPGLFEATGRWDGGLAAVQRIIEAPGASVRLVLDPASGRSVAEARAARAGVALYGLALDGVVANRMLPAAPAGPWLGALAERQRSALTRLAEEATLVPAPRELPHLGREVGPEQLPALAAPPAAAPHRAGQGQPHDRLADDGILVWRVPLPGAVRTDLGLVRRDHELVVTAGPFRHVLELPAALRRCTVAGAALEDGGDLAIRFAPDPGQWPGGVTGSGRVG